MTFEYLVANKQHLLLNCISGSNAYGLNLPTSDVDYKGVFLLPKNEFLSLEYTEQVNNISNDVVYYELGRFIDLLYKNNPNIIELLCTPSDCVLYKHPLLDIVKPELFLSKMCKDTFAGYAITQIKRAKGLNKKIVNPVERELKTILHFCYVISGQGTITVHQWLQNNNYDQADCGLVSLTHMRDMYALFHRKQFNQAVTLKGIMSRVNANEVSLSSVPKGIEPLTSLYFNKDGYSKYCKEYHEYWKWVDNRNEERYQSTLEHGKNYDAKNMMHVFRLLNMAEEIAKEKKVNVRRPDRQLLLKIRRGEFMYEDLVAKADEKIDSIQHLYAVCDLPEKADKLIASELLIRLRETFYQS